MNFRTTLILLVLLSAVGLYVFFTSRDKGDKADIQSTTKKLIDLDAKDITRVVVSPAGGQRIVFERPADKGAAAKPGLTDARDWRLVEPIVAGTQSWQVDSLVRDLTGLESRSQLDAEKKASVGLDKPAYTVELTAGGKTAQVAIGNKGAVGDSLYVQVAGRDKIDIVPSAVYDTLDKPAADYRSKKLLETSQDQIQQVTIAQPNQPEVRLEKSAGSWKIVAPAAMPGDATAVSDVLSAVTSLNAEEFITEKPGSAASTPAFYGLNAPQMTVSFSTRPPDTQPAAPATGPATGPATVSTATVLKFGRPEDIRRKSVFLSVAGPGAATATVVKVSATSMDAFKKRPLDLRDRNAVDVNPDDVSEIALTIDHPSTTQPSTRPAEQRTVRIARRKDNLQLGPSFTAGPVASGNAPASVPGTMPTTVPTTAPATMPTTGPAVAAMPPVTSPSTQPMTQPATQASATTGPAAEKPSKWAIETEGGAAADDGQVSDLLGALHPLKAAKYLDLTPATQPATQSAGTTYVLTVKTVGAGGAATATYPLTITDPGNSATPTVRYNDLSFEVERSLVRKLEGDFKTKRPPEPTPPAGGFPGSGFPGGGFPGGLPPGHPGAE